MKVLHHKSPLWAIAFTLMFYTTFGMLFYETDANVDLTTAKIVMLCFLVIFLLGYLVSAKRSRETSILGSLFVPAELYEVDEAFRAISHRATQRVYVFLSYGLPLLVLIAFAANLPRTAIVIAAGIVHVSALCIYAASTRSLWSTD